MLHPGLTVHLLLPSFKNKGSQDGQYDGQEKRTTRVEEEVEKCRTRVEKSRTRVVKCRTRVEQVERVQVEEQSEVGATWRVYVAQCTESLRSEPRLDLRA